MTDTEIEIETVGQMKVRHRDEFVALLQKAADWAKATGNTSTAAAHKIDLAPSSYAKECVKYGVDRPPAVRGRPRKNPPE